MNNSSLSMKVAAILALFLFCVLIINHFTIDSVPALYGKDGSLIAAIGMTKDEVLLKMGRPKDGFEDHFFDTSCVCYSLSQHAIRAPWRRRIFFPNNVKILFHEEKVEDIYFFDYFDQKAGWLPRSIFQLPKRRPCQITPPLAIKVSHGRSVSKNED